MRSHFSSFDALSPLTAGDKGEDRMSEQDRAQKRGMPANATSAHVALPDNLRNSIDAWRAHQPDKLSRPEAIRRLAEMGLAGR
jgi:hypothetical protein